MLPRTVILGEKPQAARWLRSLMASGRFDIVAGVPGFRERRWWGEDEFAAILREHRVPVMRREELRTCAYDILLSFLYPFIIEAEHIEGAQWYCLNLHEAPLPQYRGCNGCSHAILDGARNYGTTLHVLAPELDAGDIVDQECFSTLSEETARELYERTSIASLKLLERNITAIASGEIRGKKWKIAGTAPYPRSSLEAMKEVRYEEKWDIDDISRRVRALDFLPFKPAYTTVDGRTLYLFIDGSHGRVSHLRDAVMLRTLTELREKCRTAPYSAVPLSQRFLIAMEESLYRTRYPVFETSRTTSSPASSTASSR